MLLTLGGAYGGIRLAEIPSISNRVLPISGGMLVAIAAFWILPEVAERCGWFAASAGLAGGFVLLWLIDRYLYPVCPTCSHNRHGFAAPLLIAAGLHSFFDGWSLAVSQQKGFESLKIPFLVGIGVHKLPEGLALGALLLAALGVPWKAAAGAAAAQSMMLAGAVLAVLLTPHLVANWTIGFLAVAAGAFVYLGYHAIDSVYQRRGIPGV